jgi:hypothetical protein
VHAKSFVALDADRAAQAIERQTLGQIVGRNLLAVD